jgi:hypothetical protein
MNRFSFVFAVISIISINSIQAQLSGVYSINSSGTNYTGNPGGVSGKNYTTINNAVNALKNYGVSGMVTFNITSGTYNEQVAIPSITGVSATKRIIFQSAANDSCSVIIQYAPRHSDTNYVVMLAGADYITFRKLTIQANGSAFNNAIMLKGLGTNDVSYNIFSNNVIRSTGKSGYCIFFTGLSTSYRNNSNIVDTNYISQGFIAFYLNEFNMNTMIRKNFISDFANKGIYAYSNEGISIIANTIQSTGDYGIEINHGTGTFKVSANKVRLQSVSYLAEAISVSSTTSVSNIDNNFVSLIGPVGQYRYGIHLFYNSNANLHYNSVVSYIPGSTALYLLCSSGNTLNVYNNNVANFGGGYAILIQPDVNTDYNNLYTTGSFIGKLVSTNISNLSAWKSTTGKDAHSISVYPGFYSATDLHCGSAQINNRGNWISSFPKDIDNETRGFNPDMGADEFTPVANDASVMDMISHIPACNGLNNVVIRFKNFGTNSLTSVNLNWSVNGITQTPIVISGSGFSPMQQFEERNISIGNYNFVNGNMYKMKFWTSNPNGSADANPKNDTFTVPNLSVGLSGIYTIGSTSTDYLTINDAINDLKLKGMGCPVTFRILPGVYNEQLLITGISGTSSINTLTFESYNKDSSSVIIRYAATSTNNDYVLKLYAANYVIFRNLTIQSTGNRWANVIEIDSTSSHNVFINNVIKAPLASSNTTSSCFYNSGTDSVNFTVLENNIISGGNYGINYTASGSNNSVKRNIISGFGTCGIWLTNQRVLSISNNIISSDSLVSSVQGVYINYCNDSISITGNNITINRSSDVSGLYFDRCNGTATNQILIANNMVVVTPYSYSAKCLTVLNCKYLLILHNSLKICKGYYKTGTALVSEYSSTNLTILNNIITNFSGSYAMVIYPANIAKCDYNNIYSSDTSFCRWNSNKSTENLLEWQNLTKLDSHSVSVNPFFVSEQDLHSDSKYLDSAGTPLSQIVNDIEGETRNPVNPDIGADEFILFNRDVTITNLISPRPACQGSSSNIEVKLRNRGLQMITSLKLKWSVNNQIPNTFNAGCSINPCSDTQLYLGSYTFSSGNIYDIKIWVETVNNLADENHDNDTFIYKGLRTGMQGNYTIGKGKNYSNFNSAIADLIKSGICSNVVFTVDTGIYNEQITIPAIMKSNIAYSITFKSISNDSNLTKIQYRANYDNDNYVIQLNGANNIRFEKFTIKTLTDTAYGRVIYIRNQSKHITFSNNRIIGNNSTRQDDVCLSTDLFGNNNLNLIQNNLIQKGYGGILLNAFDYTSGLTYDSGNAIKNNTIENSALFCIYGSLQNSINISGNKLGTLTNYGIYLNLCIGKDTISNNNILINITRGDSYYGIDLEEFLGSATYPAFIANNFINLIGTAYGNTGPIIGFLSNNCNYNKIYHNTIRIGFNTYNSSTGAVKFNTYSGSQYGNIDFKNNIVINQGNIYSAIDISSGAKGVNYLKSSDYNVFYTTAPIFGVYGTSINSFSNWKSTTKLDSHSVFILPSFKSNIDLHLTDFSNVRVNNPLNNVITDIDNEVRSKLQPSAGADDYPMYKLDAGIVKLLSPSRENCEGPQSFKIRICNYGSNKLDSIEIGWKLNGVTKTPVKFKNSLIHLQEADITLGTDNLNATGMNEVTVNIISVNGTNDNNSLNNSLKVNNFNIFRKPQILSVINDTICLNSDAHLSAKTNNTNCLWYKSGSNIAISRDSTLVVKNLNKTTSYFVEAVSKGISDSLLTNDKLGSGNLNGSLVMIKALNSDISLDSLSIQLSASPGNKIPVVVYYKKGSWVGFEKNSSAWTVLDYDTVISKSYMEENTFSTGKLRINKNDTVSLFIYFQSTIGKQIGTTTTTAISNTDLSILKAAMLPGLFTGSTTNNILFNGRIYYTKGFACKSALDTVTAFISPSPNVHFANEIFVCKGKSVSLDAGYDPGFIYTWKYGIKPDTISKSQILIIDSAGLYSITVKDKCGNISSDSVRITITDIPVADFTIDNDTQCFNNNKFSLLNKSTVNIGNLNSKWDLGNGAFFNTKDVSYSYNLTGKFFINLRVVSDYNCSDSITKQVLIIPNPIVSLGKDTTILGGQKISLNAGTGYDSYLWSNGNNSKSAIIDSTGTGFGNKIVWVLVSKDGCDGSDTIIITFKKGSGIIDNKNEINIKVYPNPTNDKLNIKIDSSNDKEFKIQIITGNGSIIYNSILNTKLKTISLQNFQKGIYYLIISNDNSAKTLKFIKE